MDVTKHKTDLLISQGMKVCGTVLKPADHGDRMAIVSEGAVRWLTPSEYWDLMHPSETS